MSWNGGRKFKKVGDMAEMNVYARGQEFVFEPNDKIKEWANNLREEHQKLSK